MNMNKMNGINHLNPDNRISGACPETNEITNDKMANDRKKNMTAVLANFLFIRRLFKPTKITAKNIMSFIILI
jgi:hypothetical protein